MKARHMTGGVHLSPSTALHYLLSVYTIIDSCIKQQQPIAALNRNMSPVKDFYRSFIKAYIFVCTNVASD